MRTLETKLDGTGLRAAVVVSRFNHLITRRLLEGCLARLSELGCEDVDVLWVPGAWEIPLAVQRTVRTGRYDAVAALGAVVRGDTAHFDYVCRGVADGCQAVALESGVPVAFGVLTVDAVDQALARAARPGETGRNNGASCAEVMVEMARLIDRVDEGE